MEKNEIRFGRLSVPFTMVPNCVLEDPRLSWKAKGLYSYIVSRPKGWTMRRTDLIRKAKDGRDAIQSAVQELKDAGYLSITQVRGDSGSFSGRHWQPYLPGFEPQTDNPAPGEPEDGKPGDGESGHLVIRSSNKTEDINTEEHTCVLKMWDVYVEVTGLTRMRLTPKRKARLVKVRNLIGSGIHKSDRDGSDGYLLKVWKVMVECLWSDPWRREERVRHDLVNTMREDEQIEGWWDAAGEELKHVGHGRRHHERKNEAASKSAAGRTADQERNDIERAREKSRSRQAESERSLNRAHEAFRERLNEWYATQPMKRQKRISDRINSQCPNPAPPAMLEAIRIAVLTDMSGLKGPRTGTDF